MIYRSLLSLVIVLSVGGCAAPSKVMINAQGKQARCGSFGFGVIGTTAAIGSYLQCVNNLTALGYVDLEQFETTEAPKVEQRPGLNPSKAKRPLWEAGHVWIYQLGGTKSGTSRQEVVGKDVVNGLAAYVVEASENKMLLSEELNPIQVQEKGKIVATHTPPLQNFDWPLEIGKAWQAEGEMETPTGKINTAKNVEVKAFGIVRVPAGEFEAFYLLSTSNAGARISEVWYSPKVRQHVKLVNYTSEGRLTAELVSFSLGPSSSIRPAVPSPQPATAPQQPPSATSSPATGKESIALVPPSTSKQTPSVGPWLGVPLGPVDQEILNRVGLPASRGAAVMQFSRTPNLPPIDLDPGDVIVAIDGIEIEGPGHVAALLANKNPGSIIQVQVFRGQYQRRVEQPMVVIQGRP